MRDHQHGRFRESSFDGLANACLRLLIQRGGRLVQAQHLHLTEQGSNYADDLFLAQTQIALLVVDRRIQAAQLQNDSFRVALIDRVPDLQIGQLLSRVQVV